jgi:hypothetical protein
MAVESQMRQERDPDQAVHERDQPARPIVDSAGVVIPESIDDDTDIEENGDENVPPNDPDLTKRGTKGRRWFAIGVILLIVVAVTVPLALLLPSEPTASPQSKAMEWLENDPNLGNYTDGQRIQRYALATLFYSTNGDSWTENEFWLDDGNECGRWNTSDGSLVCTDTNEVSGLNLTLNFLQGTLPPEIGLLSKLGEFIMESRMTMQSVRPTNCIAGFPSRE